MKTTDRPRRGEHAERRRASRRHDPDAHLERIQRFDGALGTSLVWTAVAVLVLIAVIIIIAGS
jgi:hypothetical protein